MRLYTLGTCSGTEPMPGRRHTSWALEAEGGLYWFDAGEGCSYTAHLMGVDLLSLRSVVISHPHIDHTGGLANLFFNVVKLNGRLEEDSPRRLGGKVIRVLLPDPNVWVGVTHLLGHGRGTSSAHGNFSTDILADGPVFDDGIVAIEALHNAHLGVPAEGEPWRCFSFRVRAGGRTVVYSGDVRDVRELDPLLDGVDLLLMETGHHQVEPVCEYLAERAPDLGRLAFIHHGRAILEDPEGQLRLAQGVLGDRVLITEDGMTLDL